MSKMPNKLINEKSPYLLQHAYNPVHWFPWGKEAFEKARKENKPVFVSIGYSTCHWCHVMAKESFEDHEVAQILNNHFVSIKVDREERPDVDSIYMTICQMLTGEGGWPLHVFLTPEQKPFYAGTYFPKEQKYGKSGLLDLLPRLYQAYQNDYDQLEEVSDKLINAFKENNSKDIDKALDSSIIQTAYHQLAGMFDSQFGGFGKAPKFPSPMQLLFLMRYYYETKDEDALNMVEITLDGIARGGIYDHLGGGFSRYSTDEMWLIPHFEKMLYDQALLLMVYTEAYQITKIPQYEEIVYHTIQFIEREMTNPEGAFFSAIDADSEGTEGTYYVWTFSEIIDILGDDEGTLFAKCYDITEEGNFDGKSVPNLIYTDIAPILEEFNISEDELESRLESSIAILFKHRQTRTYPHLDDKVITSWNALMAVALSKAGAVFTNSDFINKAKKAIQFIHSHLVKDNLLYATYRDGETKHIAYLDDYANLLWAFVEIYEATGEDEYLEQAKQVVRDIMKYFKDDSNEGFYYTSILGEQLIVRESIIMDQIIPAGNGTIAWQLWRLGKITGDMDMIHQAESTLASFTEEISLYPTSLLSSVIALLSLKSTGREIKLSGESMNDVLTILLTSYRPFDVWTTKMSNANLSLEICKNYACHAPITDLEEAIKALT